MLCLRHTVGYVYWYCNNIVSVRISIIINQPANSDTVRQQRTFSGRVAIKYTLHICILYRLRYFYATPPDLIGKTVCIHPVNSEQYYIGIYVVFSTVAPMLVCCDNRQRQFNRNR